MYNALYFPTFNFILYVPCFPFFSIDHNRKQVLLIKLFIFFFEAQKYFLLFQLFKNDHTDNVVSTLINVMKLDVESNSIVPTLSNVNVKLEIDHVGLALFNVKKFNVDIHYVVSTLIWHCPTSRHYITLTTNVETRLIGFLVLTNVAERLHNFVKFIKLKTYIFSRIPLNCCFRKLLQRYW